MTRTTQKERQEEDKMISNYSDILKYAKEHKITIGAFNSFNMETLQAVVSAAEKKQVPLIVQTYHAHAEYAGAEYMRAIYGVAAEHASVKIALGLDHGQSFAQAEKCINVGYTGVMIDLASEDYDVNVKETKRVVELAHSKGISVEAELGVIADADRSLEEIAAGYTDPEVARRFARDTGVDCLAVSVGTAHGNYAHTPKINFELLKELVDTVSCPIVVHGGSGTPDEDVEEMVRLGIAKLNVGTDFFNAYKKAMFDMMNEKGLGVEATDVMAAARKAVEEVALHKLDILTRFRV